MSFAEICFILERPGTNVKKSPFVSQFFGNKQRINVYRNTQALFTYEPAHCHRKVMRNIYFGYAQTVGAGQMPHQV
jgi:hypothetical protein